MSTLYKVLFWRSKTIEASQGLTGEPMSQVYHTSHQGYGPGPAPPPGGYPSAIPPPYEGYPPPPGPPGPTSYQGYFENYPPPPPHDHHHHYHREHPCFSFLKGCLATLCCCCALEQCCSCF